MTKKKEQEIIFDDKEFDNFLNSFNNNYKNNKICVGDAVADTKIERLHSGSYNLDSILGGGLPYGRIVEVYGGEASGKTTTCLHAVREAQKKGERVAYIDMEHSLNPDFCKNIGIDISKLAIVQPDYGEQAIEMLHTIISSGLFKVVVVDSVAALTPKAEIEGEVGDHVIGRMAKLMSQLMRKINPEVHKTGTLLIMVNQTRSTIGGYGNPITTPGGKALKFFASIRLECARTGYVKQGDEPIGQTIKFKTVKNKVFSPFKSTIVTLIYGKGFSTEDEIIDSAVNKGIVTKKGSWYYYGDVTLGQGLAKAREMMESNEELTNEIIDKLNNNV